MSPIIELYEVTKTFEGGKAALQNASLSIRRGELFALVGPNGAGKSTVLKIIAGLLRPQSGTVVVDGLDRYRDHLAIRTFTVYLPDQPNLFLHFRGIEHLQMVGDLYGVEKDERDHRIDRLARLFDLADILKKRISTYSNGQYKKLALAGTFLTNARIYLLDEPETGGIDPPAATALMQMLEGLHARQNVTIVWATQMVHLAERMCDRIAIVNKATVQACGSLADLRQQAGDPNASLERLFTLITGENKDLLVSEVLESLSKHVEAAQMAARRKQ